MTMAPRTLRQPPRINGTPAKQLLKIISPAANALEESLRELRKSAYDLRTRQRVLRGEAMMIERLLGIGTPSRYDEFLVRRTAFVEQRRAYADNLTSYRRALVACLHHLHTLQAALEMQRSSSARELQRVLSHQLMLVRNDLLRTADEEHISLTDLEREIAHIPRLAQTLLDDMQDQSRLHVHRFVRLEHQVESVEIALEHHLGVLATHTHRIHGYLHDTLASIHRQLEQ